MGHGPVVGATAQPAAKKKRKNDIQVVQKPNGVLHDTILSGTLTPIRRWLTPREVHQVGMGLKGACGLSEKCPLRTPPNQNARSLSVVRPNSRSLKRSRKPFTSTVNRVSGGRR